MRYPAAAALLLLAACAPAGDTDDPAAMQAAADSARSAITARSTSMAAHISAGHMDTVAAMYAENAVLMPPNMPTVTGRAAILEAFQQMMAGGTGTMHFTVQNVSSAGDLAVERGRWHWTGSMGGQAVADSGKYLAHWHRMNGEWMMVEDIWNSDVPAAPPPRR